MKQTIIIINSLPSLGKLYYECLIFLLLRSSIFHNVYIIILQLYFSKYRTLHISHPHFKTFILEFKKQDFNQYLFSIFDVQIVPTYM